MSIYCPECTQTPHLLEESEIEKIYLCPDHGVIERVNITCQSCGKPSVKRSFDIFSPNVVFECVGCKQIVFEAPINHSTRVKDLTEEKKNQKLSTQSLSKSEIRCKHGSSCRDIAKSQCLYKHYKSEIPCKHGKACRSVGKGVCPYVHSN